MRTFGLLIFNLSVLLLPAVALAAECEIDGKVIPCDQMPGWFPVVAIAFLVGMLAVFIQWLWMLIHCLMNPIPDKLLWGLVILFLGPLGSLLYYFGVKRSWNLIAQATPSSAIASQSLSRDNAASEKLLFK